MSAAMSRKDSVASSTRSSTSTISVTSIRNSHPNMSTLQPCSASERLVLHAQGSSILCLRHDSLAIERRFELHTADVAIISVDNSASEALGSRVVSVDCSKTVIVWDMDTGAEISKYSAADDILIATWMKNGNLVFGDTNGNVILFDPVRAEHISARTIVNPLCAIAPSADCKSFALGYNNGSVLVVALSPAFTILHTLTNSSLSPSPIASLAWHASSSKQKSDMLAVQTRDGDLRVWSVPKSIDADETARVVRILKRPSGNHRGNNWLGWSRNGRIVQYSAGTTSIWDVRTKNVEWEEVLTADNVIGICLYGPKGSLFTFGRDHTVQQFTLYPPQLLSHVQNIPSYPPPPSPPASIEEKKVEEHEEAVVLLHDTHSQLPQGEIYMNAAFPSKHERSAQEPMKTEQSPFSEGGLGISNVPEPKPASIHKQSLSGSSRGSPPVQQNECAPPATTVSPTSGPRKGSVGLVSQPSTRKLHPLRQEMHSTPAQEYPETVASSPVAEVTEIFPHMKLRLPTVTYESPRVGGPQSNLSEDDHRKEMLFCVFGWKGDIEELICDELESINARTLPAVVLRLWLSDLDMNSLAVMLGSDFNVSADWLFLALSAMGGQSSWTHVMRAFVIKLLQKNDIHMAVLCLLAIDDKNEAVEIYISNKMYLEAVLLTSLLWKKDWKRISQLVRKWGAYALEIHEGTLAARCFACAGTEAPTDQQRPQRSRTPSVSHAERPQRSRTPSHTRSRSDSEGLLRGLSISSPTNPRTTLKMTPKDSPLKLITHFPVISPVEETNLRLQAASPTSTNMQPLGINRTFNGSGLPSRSQNSTPVGLTPVDPFWSQQAGRGATPLVPYTRAGTPGVQKLLTPVTEASPLDKAPINRLGEQYLAPAPPAPRISSPIEGTNGFDYSKPVTLGNFHKMDRAPTPVMLGNLRKMEVAPAPPPLPAPQQVPPQLRMASPPPSRIGSPPIEIAIPPENILGRGRSLSLLAKPTGLQIHWPAMDSLVRRGTPPNPEGENKKHQRTVSHASPLVPQGRQDARKSIEDMGFLDLLEKGHNRMDSQRASARSTPQTTPQATPELGEESPVRTYPRKMSRSPEYRGNRRISSPRPLRRRNSSPEPVTRRRASPEPVTRRGASPEPITRRGVSPKPFTRRGVSPEPVTRRRASPEPRRRLSPDHSYRGASREPRGRTAQIKASHMRSPSSPLPFSPQAALYRDDPEPDYIETTLYIPQFKTPRYEEPARREDPRHEEPARREDPRHEDSRGRSHNRYPTSSHRRASPDQQPARSRGRSRADDDDLDERFYTSPRENSGDEARGRGRSRIKEIQVSHMRSPSSPLPMSPQALLYQEMSAEVDRQHEEEEERTRRVRPTQSNTRVRTRMDSRTRGPQFQRQWSDQMEIRGFDRGISPAPSNLHRHASPAPSGLSRNLSMSRGLPSNPRAWRSDLQTDSRANSPAPQRGTSPSRARAPSLRRGSGSPVLLAPAPPGPRSMTPGAGSNRGLSSSAAMPRSMTPGAQSSRTLSPPPTSLARSMTPGSQSNRAMSPGPFRTGSFQTMSSGGNGPTIEHRSMTPAPAPPPPISRAPSRARARSASRTNISAMAPAPPAPSNQYYSSPGIGGFAEYESIQPPAGSSEEPYYSAPGPNGEAEYESIPIGPPPASDVPPHHQGGHPQGGHHHHNLSISISRSNSHGRKHSDPSFKPLIRKLPPVPGSPPPLPQDFPVHEALHMYLEPGKKQSVEERARERDARRMKRLQNQQDQLEYQQNEYTYDRSDQGFQQKLQEYQDQYLAQEEEPPRAWGQGGHYPNPEQYYEEMQQMQQDQLRMKHTKSPSISSTRSGSRFRNGGGRI